jgi:MFS family permease
MASDRVGAWTVLRNRNFLRLWLGQMISFIGDYFYILAIPIILDKLTGSTALVGLSVILNSLPMLLLGPVAGVFVDRWDRKRTMVVADLLRAALVLPCLLVRSTEQIWIFYVVGISISCVSRFFFPSQNALLPLIVKDREELLAANGLMQAVQTGSLLIGPALAGFTLAYWGESVAFIFDSVTYLASAVAIVTMTVPRTTEGAKRAGGQISAVLREMREGVVYLFRNATMVGVLTCLAVVQFGIGAINVVWVPYLRGTFGVGSEGLGIVDSAQGVGMVVGSIALGFLTSRLSKNAMIGWGLVVIGLSLSGMGLVPAFGYVIALGFGVGLMLVPAQSALMTMMQLAVPDLKRGRVGSAMNALTMFAGLLSMAGATVFGEVIGLRMVYVVSGLIILASSLLAFRIPEPAPLEEEPVIDAVATMATSPDDGDGRGPPDVSAQDPVVVTVLHGGSE